MFLPLVEQLHLQGADPLLGAGLESPHFRVDLGQFAEESLDELVGRVPELVGQLFLQPAFVALHQHLRDHAVLVVHELRVLSEHILLLGVLSYFVSDWHRD